MNLPFCVGPRNENRFLSLDSKGTKNNILHLSSIDPTLEYDINLYFYSKNKTTSTMQSILVFSHFYWALLLCVATS